MMALRTAAYAFGMLLSLAVGVSGQEARTAVVGDTIRVGDVVPVAIRVAVERGERVVWPDTLPLTGDAVENAARVRERVDTLPDGRLDVTGIYAVTPWRTGEVALPDVPLEVVTGREAVRTLTASLPTLDVVSVLPPDTAGIELRPSKGVIGRNWAWGPILLALLALLAVAGGLYWWWRRRRGETAAVTLEPGIPPRERALARLQEARQAGLVERGAMKEFYTRVADAVREYAAALDPAWGEDLTTTEIAGRFRTRIGPGAAAELERVLRPADQVKFARRSPDPETAHQEWDAARTWILGFQWPPLRAADEHGEAA